MKTKQISNKVLENFQASYVFYVQTVHYVRDFSDIRYIHKCKDIIPELEQIFTEMKLRCLGHNSYIHVSVSDLYITKVNLPILLQENMWTPRGNMKYECENWAWCPAVSFSGST